MFTVNKLKISGFKSFAHPTELLIEDGVTGIVGPNGCGKSNVFEAIRWVMGESSSKSLRSSSMDEVIFNGTQNIPPKNFAEVSIELDNFDGNLPIDLNNDKKLLISRTIERGVGSFYKINNKEVRAKDISILFYDSGSGPRSSSIISQGNIDQIINSKPIDRKIILEDAAGTSGLQARRHESELKLQATEVNLEKIEINLNNLKDQKNDLSRQARQAEKYEQLSENIKFNQSILVFTQWKKNSIEINQIVGSRQMLSEEIKSLLVHLSKSQDELKLKKSNESYLLQEKELLNKKIYQINNEINKYNNQLEGINNKKIELEKFIKTIENDKEIERTRFIELEKNIKNLKEKLSSPSKNSLKKKELIKLNSEEVDLKNKLKQLETIFVNEIQLSLGEEFKSDNLKENKENFEKKKIEVENLIHNLNEALIKQNNDLTLQEKLNSEYEDKVQKIHVQLDKKKNIIFNTNQNTNKLNDDIKKIVSEIEICSSKLIQIKTELKTLNLLTNNTCLASDSIVNLLKIKKGYENAVYAALTNELDATLKNSPKRWVKAGLSGLEPIENSLLNLVKGPSELDLILSQIGFLENKDQVKEKQKKLKVGQCLVDKEGQLWRWDGFISNDNLQKKKLIDSQLKIKKLEDEQKKYQMILDSLELKKNDFIKKQAEFDKHLKDENLELEKNYKTSVSIKIELSKQKQKLSLIKFNINDLKIKLKELNKNLNFIKIEIQKIESKETNSLKNDNAKNDKEIAQRNIQDLDLKLEKKRNQINLLKEEIMKEELNESFFRNDLEKTRSRLIECQKQIDVLNSRQKEYKDENEKLLQLPLSIKKKINHFQGLFNEVQKKISVNSGHEKDINKSINEILKKTEGFNKERENKVNELTRLDSNLENLKIKEKELRDTIFHRSRIQPEELEEELRVKKIEVQEYEFIKTKLEKFIFQREQMGPVNLRAKVEEKLINESIDELEYEKLDLSEAIEKLRQAINKINKEGRNRLYKAYEEVNKNFAYLFKKLFNGGEAQLELIKSDDPLQTGIEIYARPPGKKLSSISLLSGGEKALTAISLIFSIFLINPSPICILDEVDAALDESNVEKFCKLLLELKNETKTKFLIITHHKITMTSIDRVYGVTMAQKGISDIVSVDFEKIDLKEAV